jgi:hypothetical protein
MRTYDDSFSGQKIYPGKVRFRVPRRHQKCFGMEAWIGDMVETSIEEEGQHVGRLLMEDALGIGCVLWNSMN